MSLNRRDFAKLLTVSGSAALWPSLSGPERGRFIRELGLAEGPLPKTPAEPDEKFWKEVRARFLLPPDLDANQVHATMKDGVLEIAIPCHKERRAREREVEIRSADAPTGRVRH